MSASPALPGAIAIIKRARKLLRCGKISHREFAVIDALLWCCRSPTSGRIVVSYSALARLCHCARSTIATAIAKLQALGVLSRIKRYALFPWACGVGLQARQMANCYVLHHEFDQPTANSNERISIPVLAVSSYAMEAARHA